MANNENIKKSLKEWLDEFHGDTGKISDLIRNLAFAGIGLIWIFKNSDLTKNILPSELICPIKLIVLGLICDLSQYLWRALNIYVHYSIKESEFDKGKLTDTDIEDVKMPNYIQIVSWLFFITKIILIALSYYYIYSFLIKKF